MKSLGGIPAGLRLERMRASRAWHGDAFRNVRPILPRLLDSRVTAPTISEFLLERGAQFRVTVPLTFNFAGERPTAADAALHHGQWGWVAVVLVKAFAPSP